MPRCLALTAATWLLASRATQALVLGKGPPAFDELRNSVLRITATKTKFHWGRPFDQYSQTGSVGSGFVVGTDPILIATCAHVAGNADRLFVQIPEYGSKKFPAKVATICHDADVAILHLADSAKTLQELGAANIQLKAIPFASHTPPLGSEVVATGFPLGQMTLKLSTGVISGVDHVNFHYRALALQSTAIISGGNSGSPLLSLETHDVVGMNYAKNPREAQINYAVPLWRLNSVIAKHKEVHSNPNVKGIYHFHIAEPGLLLTPGQEALYLGSGNYVQTCRDGPLVAEVWPMSVFQAAVPPVQPGNFLISVDGVKLDKFGQGRKTAYVDELVDYNDLMLMRGGTAEEEIAVETCEPSTGTLVKHKVDMRWRQEREGRSVRYVSEPIDEGVDWEIFGDLLFMDLTENHIETMNGDYHRMALVRFLEPRERAKPHLAVMLHSNNGDAKDALGLAGKLGIVETVNGVPVSSLEELRKVYAPEAMSTRNTTSVSDAEAKMRKLQNLGLASTGAGLRASGDSDEAIWSLRTTVGSEYAAKFKRTLSQQVQDSRQQPYLMTKAAKSAAIHLKLITRPEGAAPGGDAALLQEPVEVPSPIQDLAMADELLPSSPLLVTEKLPWQHEGGGGVVVDYAQGENDMTM